MNRETWENLRAANAKRLSRARVVGNWKEVARITEDDVKLNNQLLEAEKAGAELAALKAKYESSTCANCPHLIDTVNELAEFKTAIVNFCKESEWCDPEWKKQHYIAKLFKLNEAQK